MANETILQHWIFTDYILPFLLVWTIVFAILQKTKILGEDKKQIDSIVAFVIALLFVGAIFPKIFVGNMILYLVVALVVIFVILMLWGFVGGGKDGFELENWMKYTLWALAGIGVIFAVFWAAGIGSETFDFLFKQNWSGTFWTNFIFVVVIAAALALVLRKGKD